MKIASGFFVLIGIVSFPAFALAYDTIPGIDCFYGLERSASDGAPDLTVAERLRVPSRPRTDRKTKVKLDLPGKGGKERILVRLKNLDGRFLDFSVQRHRFIVGWKPDPTVSGTLDTAGISPGRPVSSNTVRGLLGVVWCERSGYSDSQN
jgi:hypothetical protein